VGEGFLEGNVEFRRCGGENQRHPRFARTRIDHKSSLRFCIYLIKYPVRAVMAISRGTYVDSRSALCLSIYLSPPNRFLPPRAFIINIHPHNEPVGIKLDSPEIFKMPAREAVASELGSTLSLRDPNVLGDRGYFNKKGVRH